jgi:tRNA-splicing ligase RtcB
MSRTDAFKSFTQKDLTDILLKSGVTLISAGIDEIPMAYKSIDQVMSQQKGLVEIMARFEPRLVKMAPAKPRKAKPRKYGSRKKGSGKRRSR